MLIPSMTLPALIRISYLISLLLKSTALQSILRVDLYEEPNSRLFQMQHAALMRFQLQSRAE